MKKCTGCGKPMSKKDLKYNSDTCQQCVTDIAEDWDRELLGNDYDYFENTGYFEDHGHFGDK